MYSDTFIRFNRNKYFQDMIIKTSLGNKYRKIVTIDESNLVLTSY